jgi:hypothetical protein
MKSEPGPPMTLGGAAAARVRFIVWCLECRYQAEPATASLRAAEGGASADPAEMARRYGPETTVCVRVHSGNCKPANPKSDTSQKGRDRIAAFSFWDCSMPVWGYYKIRPWDATAPLRPEKMAVLPAQEYPHLRGRGRGFLAGVRP